MPVAGREGRLDLDDTQARQSILGPGLHNRRRWAPMADQSHTAPPSDPELRIKALESLLVEKRLIDPAAVDEIIETYEHRIGPRTPMPRPLTGWSGLVRGLSRRPDPR